MGAFLAFLPALLQLAEQFPELERDVIDVIDRVSTLVNKRSNAAAAPPANDAGQAAV